jgi:hypothetical protein
MEADNMHKPNNIPADITYNTDSQLKTLNLTNDTKGL